MSYDEFDGEFDIDSEDFDEDELLAELLAQEGHPEAVEDDEPEAILDQPDEKPSLDAVIDALKSESAEDPKPNPTLIYGLSNLTRLEVERLQPVWNAVDIPVRRAILRFMVEASEMMFQLNYRMLAISLLTDDDPRVRESAIELLWEDQTLEVMNLLITGGMNDDNRDVRAAAMTGLGRYILAGELGDLPEADTNQAIEAALAAWEDEREDINVRRRALEAFANTTIPQLVEAIQQGYESPYPEMRSSAIFAMGRSCDQRWRDFVMEEIDSDDPTMRYEAARAAGELELEEAVPKLAQLVIEPDRDIAAVAVWSLGEIGGRPAMRVLDMLVEKAEEDGDDDMLQAVDDAIGNAALASEIAGLDF